MSVLDGDLIRIVGESARALGATKVTFKGNGYEVSLDLAPLPPAPAKTLTAEEQDRKDASDARQAKRMRLRSVLGRMPTEAEVDDLP